MNQYLRGLLTLLLLISTGIILTVRLKGLQFSKLFQIKKAKNNSYYFWENNLQKR
ncbi:sodium:alanine symporter family protein [Bacillus toyonensis]|nr:sodium:alanine symporter family protein [Bacillus toyonensis]PEL40315.1 sodium:alanine symporter family protein [Bacillus toyonensis]